MRIIAGAKRGMKLLSPKGDESRPIIDRVKESLFSILYQYELPYGKIVADLFSGVGSLGLESLSRGAEFAAFVEQNPQIISVLKKNIEKAGFSQKAKIIRANAFKIGAPISEYKYHLVFVDPPYSFTKDVGQNSPLNGLLVLLSGQIVPDGIIVVRTHKSTELLERYGALRIIDRRRWGNTAITILELGGSCDK